MQSRYYFIGCPLFGLTIFITARADHPHEPNPTDRFLCAERRMGGESWLWIGQRFCVAYEPRHLRPASPLLIIE